MKKSLLDITIGVPTSNELRSLWQKSIKYCNSIKSERGRASVKYSICDDAKRFLEWIGFLDIARCWTSEENGAKATTISLSGYDGFDESGWNPHVSDKGINHIKVWPVRSDK